MEFIVENKSEIKKANDENDEFFEVIGSNAKEKYNYYLKEYSTLLDNLDISKKKQLFISYLNNSEIFNEIIITQQGREIMRETPYSHRIIYIVEQYNDLYQEFIETEEGVNFLKSSENPYTIIENTHNAVKNT